MSVTPPVNCWKQRAEALDELTTTPVTILSGATGSYGRRLDSDYTAAGHAATVHNNFAALWSNAVVNANGDNAGNAYTCNQHNPNYDVWEASHGIAGGVWFRSGCCQSAIKWVNDWQAANPGLDTYVLTKDSTYGSEPAANACGVNPINEREAWRMSIPTDYEWVIEKTTPPYDFATVSPPWNSQVGNIMLEWESAAPGAWDVSQNLHVQARCEIYAVTGIMPNVFRCLRQDATILGAWAQVKFSDLSIRTMTVDRSAHTTSAGADPNEIYTWVYDTDDNSDSAASSGPMGFAVAGIRSSDDMPCIIAGTTVDTVQSIADETWTWVDLTNVMKAVFAKWNGPYSNFVLIPIGPDGEIENALSDAEAGDSWMTRLLPSITRSVVLNSDDGYPNHMSYSATTRMYRYSALAIQNMYIAFEKGASTLTVPLNYYAVPSLVP